MTKSSNSNCFFDSNIWLYAFSTDRKEESKRLLAKQLISEEKYITISTQVINEVSYNLRKKHKIDEQSLLNLIISFYAKYPIISFNLDILESASHLRTQYHVSFWDSLIIASAVYSGANTLYSEDMQNGLIVTKKLTIVNPFKFGV
jgi:predicted nucleic acid-binding protein